MSKSRKLAAIMFTDIVGYTALMGSDEQKALSVLKANRSVHKSLIKKHTGKWLKEMGDGTLASFKTISEAVYCAGELIITCRNQEIELRVGIHFGEVTAEEGDIFGDGVNVASRLESLAEPGQILVSGSVHRIVKNKTGIVSSFLREAQLKNVDEPVKIYNLEVQQFDYQQTEAARFPRSKKKLSIMIGAVALLILIFYSLSDYFGGNISNANKPIEKSIALLPLQNISDEENDYLVSSVKNEVAAYLMELPDLKVRSGREVDILWDKNLSNKEIAEELGVRHLLEGTIWKEANRFKLRLYLKDIIADDVIWQKDWDKEYELLMDVVSEVARELVSSLSLTLNAEEEAQISTLPTKSPEAYDLIMKAWPIWQKGIDYPESADSLYTVARVLAMQALEYDSGYIQPYSLLIAIDRKLGNFDNARVLAEEMKERFPKNPQATKELAMILFYEGEYDTTMELYEEFEKEGQTGSWENIMLGRLYCFLKNDYRQGLLHLKAGINQAQGLGNFTGQTNFQFVPPVYWNIGEYQKAMDWSFKRLNSTSNCAAINQVWWTYILQTQYEKAEEFLDSICDISTCSNCNRFYFQTSIFKQDYAKARELIDEANYGVWYRYWVSYLKIKSGEVESGIKLLEELKTEVKSNMLEHNSGGFPDWSFIMACISEMLGQKDDAFKWLKTCEDRSFWYGNHDWMMQGPVFESMKDDPEFIAIYNRVQKEKSELRTQVKEMEERGELDL